MSHPSVTNLLSAVTAATDARKAIQDAAAEIKQETNTPTLLPVPNAVPILGTPKQ